MDDAFRQTPTCPRCGTAAHSSVRIFATRTYERAIRKLLPEADRRAMEAAIVADPGAAPVVRGTGGLRKVRWPARAGGRGVEFARSTFATRDRSRSIC